MTKAKNVAVKQPRGRPSLCTPAMMDAICERIAEGETLAQICRDQGMPAMSAVNNWRRENAAFDGNFARAREAGHDVIASRARETARGLGDSTSDVQRDKLIIDTDLKLLAKWDKRYSDRVTVGGDPDSPIAMTVQAIERHVIDAAE